MARLLEARRWLFKGMSLSHVKITCEVGIGNPSGVWWPWDGGGVRVVKKSEKGTRSPKDGGGEVVLGLGLEFRVEG